MVLRVTTDWVSLPPIRAVTSGGRLGTVLVLALLVTGACGGDDEPEVASTSEVTLSPECRQAFVDGHNLEVAGEATNEAFLPSMEACGSLEEWTAAAMDFGVDLRGQEATFVDGVCAAADDATRSRPICEQALERFRAGR